MKQATLANALLDFAVHWCAADPRIPDEWSATLPLPDYGRVARHPTPIARWTLPKKLGSLMRNDAGEHVANGHRLQPPNCLQSDSAINVNHGSVEGLKVHPDIHCAEMPSSARFVSPFRVCVGEGDS
jgi:hypothetical protein